MKPKACPSDAAVQWTATAPLAASMLRTEPAEQQASKSSFCVICLQVITPMRKVAAGTNHLNTVLQSRLNRMSPTAGTSQKSALPTLSNAAATSGATGGECFRQICWQTVGDASMCTCGGSFRQQCCNRWRAAFANASSAAGLKPCLVRTTPYFSQLKPDCANPTIWGGQLSLIQCS